jgi:soluble lytic murein transglycosylase-like protein
MPSVFVTSIGVPILLASIVSFFDLLPFLSPPPEPGPATATSVQRVEPTATTVVVEPTATAAVVEPTATVRLEPTATVRVVEPTPSPTATAIVATPTAQPSPTRPAPTATARSYPSNREVGILRPAATATPVPYAGQPLSPAVPGAIARWEPEIRAAAEAHRLDPNLIAALMVTESGGDAGAISPANAVGLLQIVDGPAEPRANVLLGTRMLVENLRLFDDDLELALAAYNAGPGNVLGHKGIPPFEETRAHVKRTMDSYQRFRAAAEAGRAQALKSAS